MPSHTKLDCKRRVYKSGRDRAEREYDYVYAQNRANLDSPRRRHKYNVSVAADLSIVRRKSESKAWQLFQAELLRPEFTTLAAQWRRETRHLSLVSKKIANDAYFRITGMGKPVIPLLLEELRDRPAHWFAALRATTNFDPCPSDANPAQAREAWINWGRSEGYIE
jgi:hypothetical protein